MDIKGCFTAIVTPFVGSGVKNPVDWSAYREILSFQDKNGVAGIVACGTTGESPTLSHEEHSRVIEETVKNSRGIVIAGTGSNSTWEAVKLSCDAENIGADASLQVCPYYNKPSQEGLFRHFGAVAVAVDIPIILYNIPGRSAREISADTMARLSEEYSNIIGVKEASGNEAVWKEIREKCGKAFLILSGNDGDTYRLMKDYGAKGVISVASNVIPRQMVDFANLGLGKRFSEMKKEDERLRELFDTLFVDTNPIPIKEAMNLAGVNAGGFRLPMCEISEKNRKKVADVMKWLGV
ncbi:MAG: 4-hydroxy-tetrahydrodipicolinate synthase, partial [Candidatus Hydrothermarchaeaceae archaeon]